MTFACEKSPTGIPAALAANTAAQVPTLMSDAILLRAIRTEDFALYAEICTSARGASLGRTTREDAWFGFANLSAGWLLHGHGGWAIEDLETGDLMGFVLLGLEPGSRDVELGCLIADAAEGLGIAYEAAQMARAFAFDTLKLDQVISYIDPQNTRAIALAERLDAAQSQYDTDTLAFIHTSKVIA